MESYILECTKFLLEAPVNDAKFDQHQFPLTRLFEKVGDMYKLFVSYKTVESSVKHAAENGINNTSGVMLLKKYELQFEILKLEFKTDVELMKR